MLRSVPVCSLARLGAAALGLLPLCLAAQSAPALIDKLEKGDVMHVGDDNASRMDLVSVLMAASRPKCEAADPGFAKLASYIAYLGSDSVTGQYPSGEFLALGVMGILGSNENTRADDQETDFDAPWMLNRNAAAMLEIGSHGCDDRRFRTVVANLFKTLDHHMAWHEQKLGTRAPLMKQSVVPVRAADWRAAVERDVDLPAQPAVTAQLTQLEARGASYLDCVYGPQNPDSTGSTQVDFWNKDVAIAGGELQKLSRKHPLAKLGDVALTECPASLPEAQTKLGESRRVAQSKIDPSSLPPAPPPLELAMGEQYQNYLYAKQSWLSYQSTHNPTDLQHAIDTKAVLLRMYGRSCNIEKNAPGGFYCEIVQHLKTEFAVIPDGPTSPGIPTGNEPTEPFFKRSNPAPAAPARPVAAPAQSAPPAQRSPGAATAQSPPAAPQAGPAESPAALRAARQAAEQSRARVPGAPPATATRGPAAAPSAAARGPAAVPSAAGGFPAGTSLLVEATGPIDLTAPRTYAGTLALPARYRGQELAPVKTEVVLEVGQPQAVGPSNAVFAPLSVTAVMLDGKRVAVKTQPVMRPIPANGQALPGSGTLPANTRFTFVVVP